MDWDGTGCGDNATVMSATTASTSTSTHGSLWSDEEVRALIASGERQMCSKSWMVQLGAE